MSSASPPLNLTVTSDITTDVSTDGSSISRMSPTFTVPAGTRQMANLMTNATQVTDMRSSSVHPSTTEDSTASGYTTQSYGSSNSSAVTTVFPDTSTARTKTVSSTRASGFSGKTPIQRVKCSEPLAITGGKLLSTGPYLANVSSAVYSCVVGYVMTGQAKIGCNGAGVWDAKPPKCVPVDNRPDVHNHISLDDSTKVPLWLTVILCVAFGLLCLLLLVCLLTYCLKIFGCWKGSAVGAKLVVRESGAQKGLDGGTSVVMIDDFGSKDEHYRSKHVPYEEKDDGFRPLRNNPNNITPRVPDGSKGRMFRREAKMPANKTWMPHNRTMRNINTSTK